MAAKERKSTVTKHLNKDSQSEKDKTPETPKPRRSRKAVTALPNDNKSTPEQKSPGRKRKKEGEGGSTPKATKRRMAPEGEEEGETAVKTPNSKSRKPFLEKELEDILENATGRNTPSMPRNRKEETNEEKGTTRTRKSDPETPEGVLKSKKNDDDDNVSVRSFRTRKNLDKDVEDDASSVKSVSVKGKKNEADDDASVKSAAVKGKKNEANDDDAASVKSVSVKGKKSEANDDDAASVKSVSVKAQKNEANNEDAGSVRALPKAVGKTVSRKPIAVIKRPKGRPRKTEEEKAKGAKKPDKPRGAPKEPKRMIKKPLRFQTKLTKERKLKANLLIKKLRLPKINKKPAVNAKPEDQKEEAVQHAAETPTPPEGAGENVAKEAVDKDAAVRVRKRVKKDDKEVKRVRKRGPKKESAKRVEKDVNDVISQVIDDVVRKFSADVYNFSDNEAEISSAEQIKAQTDAPAVDVVSAAEEIAVKAKKGRPKKPKITEDQEQQQQQQTPKVPKSPSNIHYEMTRSPEDSSVIIVQPRLGPRTPRTKRSKPEDNSPNLENPVKRRRRRKAEIAANDRNSTAAQNATVPVAQNAVVPAGQNAMVPIAQNAVIPIGQNQTVPIAQNSPIPIGQNPMIPIGQNPAIPIGSSYFVQPLGNFNLLSTNSTIIRSYNPNPNPNFDSAKPVGPDNLPYLEEPPKVPPNEIIFAPIVLSGGRFVPQNPCFPNDPTNILLQKPLENLPPNMLYPNNAVLPPTTNTAILLKRPEAMTTSLISTTSAVVINQTNQGVHYNNITVKQHAGFAAGFTASTQTDTTMTEKALEGDSQLKELPTIPVAKNVTDLLNLKNKRTEIDEKTETKMEVRNSKTEEKKRRRILRNVRRNGDATELTFSEPETSFGEAEEKLHKTASCDRLPVKPVYKSKSNLVLQLGSEPIELTDTLASFETTSSFLLPKKEQLPTALPNKEDSPSKSKDAVEVCSFSKGNEEALKELGLDSDVDPGTDKDQESASKKAKIKEEIDNVLKEMPVRKIPNLYRNRLDTKNPLSKTNDYTSPPKAPTVIDKLLEKNKNLKRAAEEEGRYQNLVRNLSENFDEYDKPELKPKRTLRETKKKLPKNMEARRMSHKKYVGGKIFERRGSNPEVYSVSNENLPLLAPDDGYKRRGSIDYETIQKVIDRRCSLPTTDDVHKRKTDNKIGLLSPKPRVINIITGDDGSRRGQNLMDEIGIRMEKVNGEESRRISIESSNSETENLKNLIDGLDEIHSDDKMSNEVPYEKDDSKIRLGSRKSEGDKNEEKSSLADETPEDLATKETILSALGLQSLKAAAQNARKKKDSQTPILNIDNGGYTGTLKTVIKIHRQEKKGNSKSPMKMIYKASSSNSSGGIIEEPNYEPEVEVGTKEEPEENASEESKNGNGKAKSLVIPEKASSFSIHPHRMCSDVCTYCFGKFGLLDTPCHIAQLKDADKRRNILATEVHLTADSCLCDACFRHVDKKSNCPTFADKRSDKRKYPTRKQICCVQNCNADSQHSVRRKSFLKLKKSIGRKIVLDPVKLEKLQPGHLVTLCHRHIYWIDYFMSCGICKKRLTSVNMFRVGPEVLDLNTALSADGIPTILTEKRFLCKICNCYASIRIKYKDPSDMTSSHRQFYETCRKRILQCHGIDVPDSEPEGEIEAGSEARKGRSKKPAKPTATITNETSKSDNETEASNEETEKPTETVKDNEVKEATHMNIPPKTNGNLDFGGVSITPSTTEVNPTQIHVKLGNLNIGALGNLNIGQDVRHGSRPGDNGCFPTENELGLRAHFDLSPSAEDNSAKTARKGFEKFTTTIQFNPETKNLFYNLQMPYGNHSSFFRHLILLEKYFRNGDLVISRNADPKAVNYVSSVQNRIRSYEGVHSVKKPADIPPSLSILPQPPVKTEVKNAEVKPSMTSRPFTLTPMPSPITVYPKNSPLSQIQATVQNIPTPSAATGAGIVGSLLKSATPSKSGTGSGAIASHPKPEVSITSVTNETSGRKSSTSSGLTSKIQENLRNLASKTQTEKNQGQARAVILNRTVGGQRQSLVQVTTGGKTIHLTLSQFRRIQQMQLRKKQYLEHQARLKSSETSATTPGVKAKSKSPENYKNLSAEWEIEEIKKNGSDLFPIISEVRTLAGEESSWDKKSDSNDGQPSETFPKIPKTLSVSVTKIPPPDYSIKEQSIESIE